MEERDQSKERIKEVTKALQRLDQSFDIIEEDLIEVKTKDLSFFRNAPNYMSKIESVKIPLFSLSLPKPKPNEKFFQFKDSNKSLKAALYSDGTFYCLSKDDSNGTVFHGVSFGIYFVPEVGSKMLMQVLKYGFWDATVDPFRGVDEQPNDWTTASSENWKYTFDFDGSKIKAFNITPEKEELMELTLI
jgi:hypothetical protein